MANTANDDDGGNTIAQMVALCRALETCIELTSTAIVQSAQQALGLYGFIAQLLSSLGGAAPTVATAAVDLAAAQGDLARTAGVLQQTQAAAIAAPMPPLSVGATPDIDPRKAALDKMYIATVEMLIGLMQSAVTTQKSIEGITLQIATSGRQDLDTAINALTAATVARITRGDGVAMPEILSSKPT